MPNEKRSVLILGTRGVPAAHGGFETFAERLALFLAGRGWDVGVYCQEDVARGREGIATGTWRGVERIVVSVAARGPVATLLFDWRCVRHAAARDAVCLVLGYNGAVFLPFLRLYRRRIVTNMYGIEWRRRKWGPLVKAWFWVNEWIAAWTSQRLVADHPAIADHLATRRPRTAGVTIPYGADIVTEAPVAPVAGLGLSPGSYVISIARIEPDNSILAMVEAFSRKPRGARLVVLGTLDDSQPYHRAIRAAASQEVLFPGAIYEADTVRALRFHARAYLHGHMVGGTNPSLVEALAAGNAVIAHDNPFNRWTAGAAGRYFADADGCERLIEATLADERPPEAVRAVAHAEAARFDWTEILEAYEAELLAQLRPSGRRPRAAAPGEPARLGPVPEHPAPAATPAGGPRSSPAKTAESGSVDTPLSSA